MSDTSIEVRLAEMAGEIKAMNIEVKNLVKLVEKDVTVLREDHEHLKASHKMLDQATAEQFGKVHADIDELKHDRTRLKAWGTAVVFIASGLGWLTSFVFEHAENFAKVFS